MTVGPRFSPPPAAVTHSDTTTIMSVFDAVVITFAVTQYGLLDTFNDSNVERVLQDVIHVRLSIGQLLHTYFRLKDEIPPRRFHENEE